MRVLNGTKPNHGKFPQGQSGKIVWLEKKHAILKQSVLKLRIPLLAKQICLIDLKPCRDLVPFSNRIHLVPSFKVIVENESLNLSHPLN